MDIIPGTDNDIPRIVNLLKISLGEDLMPKSEAYWRWKHVNNPFGRSKVLLAIEGSELVGVRAFMRWRWNANGRSYEAVRAVDTATHPQHQGKGIFKKLTLQLVDECKRDGVHFIFNTPNNQSGPGYLKMGWESAGQLPISFHLHRPVAMAYHTLTKTAVNPPTQPAFILRGDTKVFFQNNENIRTDYSLNYLKWRYEQVPVAQYATFYLDESNFLVYRIKSTRFGLELRICDVFAQNVVRQRALIRELYRTCNGFHYATLSGIKNDLPPLSLKFAVGPLVTVRNLNLPSLSPLTGFHEWAPALGDLELF